VLIFRAYFLTLMRVIDLLLTDLSNTYIMSESLLNQIRIVLVNTSDCRNMGSAARAMKTMGLTQLFLV